MRKEIKDIFGLLVLVLPVFILMVFGWLNSPMYQEVKADERLAAQEYLIITYYFSGTPDRQYERQNMIKYYGFTENEITPTPLDSFLKTHYNQNLGGSKER